MTTNRYTQSRRQRRLKGHPLAIALARLMAAAALLNFGLVLFDFTYISWRDFYLARIPFLTRVYDPVKGIEPYRDTDQYLKTVAQLETEISSSGLDDPNVEALLASLRSQSLAMITENPFELADKTGSLEKIKNRMRDRLSIESSKEAFEKFWSVDYLQRQNVFTELEWFDRKVGSLIATNYFRPFGESGGFVDYFWLIDIWFVGLFGADILIRAFVIRRKRPGITWADALLWRWYDWVLLIPFWRIVRIMPVTLRSHQVGWIDLGRIEDQVTGFLAEHLLDDMSEMILVRVFNTAQATVRDSKLKQWLANTPEAVEINDVNEIQVITERLMTVVVMKVLPQVQPELESVLRHAIEQGVQQLPIYRNLQFIPGINVLPNEITRQVVHQLTEVTSQTLEQTLKDKKGQELATRLAEAAVQSLQTELQDQVLLTELQQLIGDLLEEWKLTLVQNFDAQDVEKTATEIAKIRQTQTLQSQNSAIEVVPARKSFSSGSS